MTARSHLYVPGDKPEVLAKALDLAEPDVEARLRGLMIDPTTEVSRLTRLFRSKLVLPLAGAVVVATAKGILRFPELQAARERAIEVVGEGRHAADTPSQVDIITEYFLVGSLTSWLLAVVLGLAAS